MAQPKLKIQGKWKYENNIRERGEEKESGNFPNTFLNIA